MIRSFRHRGLERLFLKDDRRGVSPSMTNKIKDILSVLKRANRPGDMDLPGFGLHPMKGDRAGDWAVKVTGNWRIVFRFDDGDVVNVDLEDYH